LFRFTKLSLFSFLYMPVFLSSYIAAHSLFKGSVMFDIGTWILNIKWLFFFLFLWGRAQSVSSDSSVHLSSRVVELNNNMLDSVQIQKSTSLSCASDLLCCVWCGQPTQSLRHLRRMKFVFLISGRTPDTGDWIWILKYWLYKKRSLFIFAWHTQRTTCKRHALWILWQWFHKT
jgi:hypothetical protein